MPPAAVRVKGLAELNRAFKGLEADVRKEMRRELREVGEPVRLLAEQMAAGNISNIGATWSRMKLGVTSRVVYVAPRARRKGGSPRGNLRGLLETQMQQALDGRTTDVIRGFENLLDRLSNSRGF